MFWDYSKLDTLYEIGEVHFRAKAKNERFTAAGWCCRQNLKSEIFMSSFDRLRHQNSAARAALLPSFVQPIKSLICGVVVANAVVIS